MFECMNKYVWLHLSSFMCLSLSANSHSCIALLSSYYLPPPPVTLIFKSLVLKWSSIQIKLFLLVLILTLVCLIFTTLNNKGICVRQSRNQFCLLCQRLIRSVEAAKSLRFLLAVSRLGERIDSGL